MSYWNHHFNFTGNEFVHSGQRQYTSSAARTRFRTRTLLASFLFVAMLGSIIHVINMTRSENPFVSPEYTGSESSVQSKNVAWDAYTGTTDTTAYAATANSIVRTTGQTKTK